MHRNEGENMTSEGLFSTSPPYSVLDPDFMNSIQEELMNVVINGAGLPLLSKANDTRTQLLTAIQRLGQRFDYYVTSQETFNALFTRTAANTYKINSSYKSVLIREVTGGYSVASILSDGDTWGDIYTNNCTHLEFENGAYLNFGNSPGNVTVDTDGCLLKNVDVQGTGTVASAVTNSFYLQAHHVTFDNCKTSNRLSNTTFNGFEGSGTALHNITSKYVNCSVYTLTSSGILRGIYVCMNLNNCIVYNLESTGNTIQGISNCSNVSNCYIYGLDSTASVNGMILCNNISSCYIEDLDSSSGLVRGIYSSYNISSCKVFDIQSANNQDVYGMYQCTQVSGCEINQVDTTGTGDVYGMKQCDQVSGCKVVDLDGAQEVFGYHDCDNLSSCIAEDLDCTVKAEGFQDCNNLSGCHAYDISTPLQSEGFNGCSQVTGCKASAIDCSGAGNVAGFYQCYQLSGCLADDIDANSSNAYGFWDCDQLSACKASDIDSASGTASGFDACNYGSGLYTSEAVNGNNDWMDTNDAQIANQYSCPAVFT